MEYPTTSKTSNRINSLKVLCINQILEIENKTGGKTGTRQGLIGQQDKTAFFGGPTRQAASPPSDRNRQFFENESKTESPGQSPLRASAHIGRGKDLRGFGCASDSLPFELQRIGELGWRLERNRKGKICLVATIRNPDQSGAVNGYMANNYEGVIAAFEDYERGRHGDF